MFRTMIAEKDVVIFKNFSDEWDMLVSMTWHKGFDSKEEALEYLRRLFR